MGVKDIVAGNIEEGGKEIVTGVEDALKDMSLLDKKPEEVKDDSTTDGAASVKAEEKVENVVEKLKEDEKEVVEGLKESEKGVSEVVKGIAEAEKSAQEVVEGVKDAVKEVVEGIVEGKK